MFVFFLISFLPSEGKLVGRTSVHSVISLQDGSFPTVCSSTTNLEASADTAGSLSLVPSVLKLLQNLSKHNKLTNLKKNIFGLNFSQRIFVIVSVLYCDLKFITYSVEFRDLELNGMCRITVTLSLATRERKAFVSAQTVQYFAL